MTHPASRIAHVALAAGDEVHVKVHNGLSGIGALVNADIESTDGAVLGQQIFPPLCNQLVNGVDLWLGDFKIGREMALRDE